MEKVFIPQETQDRPFDITLVVADGKEFKVHRRVLSEASPFFEKVLNSDMKESDEGVIHLEMLTELGMRDILEFIYTGNVQISSEDHAQDLIAMADYLVLPYLKTVAGNVLAERLNASNSIWTYYFAEKYHCEKLSSRSRIFIMTNFTTVAETREFLNLSSEEVKMWISSDYIEVGAEDDVFKIVLTWIDRDKTKRKKYFADLFLEVRLPYVSRDYLHSDIMLNDLVNDNSGCMDLVRDAIKDTDCKDNGHLRVGPRKSLEIPVLLVCLGDWEEEEKVVVCYYPREDKWSRFHGTVPPNTDEVFSCSGKLYFLSQRDNRLSCYDTFSNCWTSLPYEEESKLHQLFVGYEDTIFALVCNDERSCPQSFSLSSGGRNSACQKSHPSFLTKYKPDSNSWEYVTPFDSCSRKGICIVAKDNFIYFLGGEDEASSQPLPTGVLTNADRFDLITNTWNKIADIQVARRDAYGAALHGNIFTAGGFDSCGMTINACEVFNETENEWQLIASLALKIERTTSNPGAMADGTLYILGGLTSSESREYGVIECYDPDKNEWKEKTRIPSRWLFLGQSYFLPKYDLIRGTMRVFKESYFVQKASYLESSSKADGRKCVIM